MDNDCVLAAAGGGTAHPVTEKLVAKIRRLTIGIPKFL